MKSKINMEKFVLFLCIVVGVTLTSCGSDIIDGENVEETTGVLTYKKNGKLVSGTVVFYKLDKTTTKKYKEVVIEVKEGNRINKGYFYYSSGAVAAEYPYDENGLITGIVKYFFENGRLETTSEYKENKLNGITKEYNIVGNQTKEIIYEAGEKIKEYEFKDGKKVIPAIEKLELLQYKTGFYRYQSFDRNQVLYQPIVIMKWKNISNDPLTEVVKIEGVFIDNNKDEELSRSLDYFQGYTDSPLQSGLSRQSYIQSDVGYVDSWSIRKANMSCQIFINGTLYKTVKIKNEHLLSNRIQ